MRPEGTAAELERRRRRAIAPVDAWESPSVVTRILGVTASSLRRWRRLACQPDGLAAKPVLGRKPRLTAQQLAELETLLNQGAVAHGWPNYLWTCKRVAVLIQRHFRIRYHPGHIYRLPCSAFTGPARSRRNSLGNATSRRWNAGSPMTGRASSARFIMPARIALWTNQAFCWLPRSDAPWPHAARRRSWMFGQARPHQRDQRHHAQPPSTTCRPALHAVGQG